jgi:hypothetical protein
MTTPAPKWPERHKRAGVAYAVSPQGLELPVIDVTHPLFSSATEDAELDPLRAHYWSEAAKRKKVPRWIQRLFWVVFLRQSIIGRGLLAAAGGFLDWQSTYLMKLTPENLGEAYARKLDHRIVASLPGVSMRLRLRQMAELLAEDLATRLSQVAPDAELVLVNIGGGPAMDSINALLLLRRERPSLLASRRVRIRVLDLKSEGATFGVRALAALQADGGGLRGIDVTLDEVPYDWAHSGELKKLLEKSLPANSLTAVSSEGALFEYGSDEEIVSNLQQLKLSLPAGTAIVGSVTRGDDLARAFHGTGGARVIPRGLERFGELAARGGWRVDQSKTTPLSDQVRLVMA